MYCMSLMAQDNKLDANLKYLYKEFWTRKANEFDTSKAENILSQINENNYSFLSDSAKYSYHYFSAGLFHEKNDRGNEKIHIDKAVKLRESSMGILNPEYLELIQEQGKIMEDENIDKAIYIYQKGLLVGQTIISTPKAQTFSFQLMTECYGNIMGNLAELYEKKGWTARVEVLYKTAFRYRTYYNLKSDPVTYVDLHMLSNYYQRKKEYKKAVEILEWEVDYIKDNGFYGSSAFVNALYMLGSAYSYNEQRQQALETYKTAIKIACDSIGSNDDNLYWLYGNYCAELAEQDKINDLDKVLPIAYNYYNRKDSLGRYVYILYEITNRFCEKNMYDKAEKYCDSLLLYESYYSDYVELAYSKRALIALKCNMPYAALQWKEKALKSSLRNNGENSPVYINNLSDMAYLYGVNSMTEESTTTYLKLKQLLESINCDTIPLYNQTIFTLYNLYETNTNPGYGYHFLKECKKKSLEKYGSKTTTYAGICNNLSVYEMNSGKIEEAQKNNKVAEDVYYELEGTNSGNYSVALHNKGKILMLNKKYKQAYSVLLESKRIQLDVYGIVSPKTEQYIKEIEDIIKK